MWARWRKRLYYAAYFSLVAALFGIFALTSEYNRDPSNTNVPDPATGHIFQIPVKGRGPIYITEAEYAPYRYLIDYLIDYLIVAGFGYGVLAIIDKVLTRRRP